MNNISSLSNDVLALTTQNWPVTYGDTEILTTLNHCEKSIAQISKNSDYKLDVCEKLLNQAIQGNPRFEGKAKLKANMCKYSNGCYRNDCRFSHCVEMTQAVNNRFLSNANSSGLSSSSLASAPSSCSSSAPAATNSSVLSRFTTPFVPGSYVPSIVPSGGNEVFSASLDLPRSAGPDSITKNLSRIASQVVGRALSSDSMDDDEAPIPSSLVLNRTASGSHVDEVTAATSHLADNVATKCFWDADVD